ncbi:MAG: MFS transporter [Pseudomonadota bacterium]
MPNQPQHDRTPNASSNAPRLARALIARSPVFYGWFILGCVCAAGFARQGPAVSTLSIFISPMGDELGWSRTAISGAVSLGGVLAALTSPMLGTLLDRHGARVMLVSAVLATGVCVAALAGVETLVAFYLLYCISRLCFAGPFDLGIYGAINAWFVVRRPIATAVATVFQMAGLTAMPLIATAAMLWAGDGTVDWRSGWLAVGLTVIVVGLMPNLLLMVRRPEDVGLTPDGPPAGRTARNATAPAQTSGADAAVRSAPPPPLAEPAFTRAEALRTPAFWLLSLFTFLIFPVQAGTSLHQAPHLIERGLDPATAATVVATFSAVSALAGLVYGSVVRATSMRLTLVSIGICLGASSLLMISISSLAHAYAAAALFGFGIGGMLTMLPIAWADYFGRRSFGAIRGVALTIQVVAQAIGPLLSGALRDLTGDYTVSLTVLGSLGLTAAGVAVFAAPPRAPSSNAPQ